MTDFRRQLFDIWAPPESPWSLWAKPVLFATMRPPSMEFTTAAKQADAATHASAEPGIYSWLPRSAASSQSTAWILELPGTESVRLAVQMALRGCRPVPLFNAAPAPIGTPASIDINPISDRLAAYATEIANAPISPNAPPVFMLDSQRLPLAKPPKPGTFDNRWVVLPQDFPSARHLLKQRIDRAVLVRHRDDLADDLRHVLRRWQEAGIRIELLIPSPSATTQQPTPYDVPKPSQFRKAWHRVLTLAKLTRNSVGGFGAIVPEHTSSSS